MLFERLVNVTLMLAKCNLPFCGSSEELSKDNKDNKDNFLFIIQLLAKYDAVLDKLLPLSRGFPKYLNHELISVLAEKVLGDIKSELQSTPFFAIIRDTTQDVNKKDHLSKDFIMSKSITMMMEHHQNLQLLKHLPHLSRLRIHLLLDCTN